MRELLSIFTERNSTTLKLKCSTGNRKPSVIGTSGPKTYTIHGTTFFGTISPITPHSCEYMQCNEGTDNTNPGKTRTSSHTSNVHLIEKVDKITYISNWLDFFGRSNLELTKKRSFTRVSGRRKRCNSASLYGAMNAGNLIFQIFMFSHDK